MLKRAAPDEIVARNMRVVVEQTHREAKIDARRRIQIGSAELEHVSETLGLAMLTGDAVVVVRKSEE